MSVDGRKLGAWSPGFMAQRSATIHIASEDAQQVRDLEEMAGLTIVQIVGQNPGYIDVKIANTSTIAAGDPAEVPRRRI